MQNWHWLLIGGLIGYAVAKRGGSSSFGVSFSAGGSAQGAGGNNLSNGSGDAPFGEPRGSEPYQTIGGWDANIPGMFPDYVDPGSTLRIVNGGAVD